MIGTRVSTFADTSTRRLDREDWAELYVVGDVHGCSATLRRLIDVIRPENDDLVVFVGDLVRKGPDSTGVIETVRERENFISVRGNNERKLLEGRAQLPSLTAEDVSFLESLPVAIRWDGSLVVHGGVAPSTPLAEHSASELLTMRSLTPEGGYHRPYWFETRRESPRVFFGHTVLSEPFETDWAVGLDTGCVYGGRLTAYRCSTGEFIAVDSTETHVDRSADLIVDPRNPDPVA